MATLTAVPFDGGWRVSKGTKWAANLSRDGNKILQGKCNIEDAKDAIFLYEQSLRPKSKPLVDEFEPKVNGSRGFVGHRTPQVIITLSPKGKLQAELPALNGTRRVVELKGGIESFTNEPILEKTLKRMLEAQARGDIEGEIGQDGAPTNGQVRHWERHSIWTDERCRFCLAEGRIKPRTAKKALRAQVLVKSEGIEIRRLTEVRKKREAAAASETKAPKGAPIECEQSMEELGL